MQRIFQQAGYESLHRAPEGCQCPLEAAVFSPKRIYPPLPLSHLAFQGLELVVAPLGFLCAAVGLSGGLLQAQLTLYE